MKPPRVSTGTTPGTVATFVTWPDERLSLAQASASPLYPHLERMSLAPAAADFALDSHRDGDPRRNQPHFNSQIASVDKVAGPTMSPASLLFRTVPSSPMTTSQLNFSLHHQVEQASASTSPPFIAENGDILDQSNAHAVPSPASPLLPGRKSNATEARKPQKLVEAFAVTTAASDVSTMSVETASSLVKIEGITGNKDGVTPGAASETVPLSAKKDEKRFPCTEAECTATFAQLAHLKIHLRRHTGERPFVCAFCNKSFNQKGNLKTHERKHTGDKPFKCTFEGCTKEFSQQGNLRTHEKIHLNVKQFKCEQCSKAFSQFGNLKSHIQKVHEKPQAIRRPRANSSSAISKPPKAPTSSAAIAVAAAAAARRTGGSTAAANYSSFLMDRYYTPSLATRTTATSASAPRSGDLSTPPPSDWSLFDRDLLGSFEELSSDEEVSEEEEEEEEEFDDEGDEAEFDEFEDQFGVMGGMDGVDAAPESNSSLQGDEEARLLLSMLDTTYRRPGVSTSSLSRSFVSPPAIKSTATSNRGNHPLGTSLGGNGSVAAASSFSLSQPALANGGVKKRKEKKLPPAVTSQVRLRGRSLSMGRLEVPQFEDGLQFLIDGVDEASATSSVSRKQTSQSEFESGAMDPGGMMMDEDFSIDASAASFEEEEAARVLASVSFDVPNSFVGSYNGNGPAISFRSPPSRGVVGAATGGEGSFGSASNNSFSLLATAAAASAAHEGLGSFQQRSRRIKATSASLQTQVHPQFGSATGVRRHSNAHSIGSSSFAAKSFERSVMAQFVDAVAKRSAALGN